MNQETLVRNVVTVQAPANIAVIKYWGARDLERAVPVNPSISMTLSSCVSTTSVQLAAGTGEDEILLATDDGLRPATHSFRARIAAHLQTLRQRAGRQERFRVATRNSFPAAAGMASSASGFAALTVAVTEALGLQCSEQELSELARLSGSGSAARSVMGGWVEWPTVASGERMAAAQLATAGHWTLCDIIAVVQQEPKDVSSLDGHRRAPTSPHFERRLSLLPERLERVRRAIADRDLPLLGEMLEEDAIELHLVAMSSRPPIFYWAPATLAVHQTVRDLRAGGHAAFFTMDAGANVHVLCDPADETAVADALRDTAGVLDVIRDRTGDGPRRLEGSLFEDGNAGG